MTPYGIDKLFVFAKNFHRNSYRFYSHASAHCDSADAKWLFEQLTDQTRGDQLTVSQLHSELSAALEANGVGQAAKSSPLSMQLMSGGDNDMPQFDPMAELTGEESTDQLISRAAVVEEQAAAFFTALAHLVSAKAMRRQLTSVADHHRTHWAQLRQLATMHQIYPTQAAGSASHGG